MEIKLMKRLSVSLCIFSCGLTLSASITSAAQDEHKVRAIAGVNIMKQVVPVPERLKINKAMITAKGDVCYEFRFPNASGGISIQKAVLPVKGDSLLIPLSDGFRKAWNSKCASKKGEDVVDYLELATR
jgi:hypothetical protein